MRYISLNRIMDDISDHPLLKDINFDRVVNYAQQFLQILGVTKLFYEKTAYLKVNDYRAELPCDFHEIIQVRNKGGVYRSSADSFHMSDEKSGLMTYKIQGNCIFTSNKTGEIEIAYYAMPVDNEGFPMIPEDEALVNALELYIKQKQFNILFDLGKIQGPVFQQVQQEYTWAVGQAKSSLTMPSVDELHSISNEYNSLVPRTNAHSYGYAYTGDKENIKVV